ncbi:MAG: hypothetical protein IJ795_07340 [Bacteroidales bacterium]|nr:hypothetical protein [Bacteroidales bacterium]
MKDYLKSPYIIDGIRMDATPMEMIHSAGGADSGQDGASYEPIVDETLDASVSPGTFSAEKIADYLDLMKDVQRRLPLAHCGSYSKACIARALCDTLWLSGSFSFEDLALSLGWKWDMSGVGGPSSFYDSVEASCDYLDSLGLKLKECGFAEARTSSFWAKASLDKSQIEEEEETADFSVRKGMPRLGRKRRVGERSVGNRQDWIIFVPFDTCAFRLGGSLLGQVAGEAGGSAPQILDPDYFIDCFEVVRELVEDGIVTAGVTVGDGGILKALSAMMEDRGMDVDLGGMSRSYGEKDLVRLLFAEVPGVIIEIKDSDYDYIDAEFLLQDVAYYPLGHPGEGGLRVHCSDSSEITGILQSLLDDATEGED